LEKKSDCGLLVFLRHLAEAGHGMIHGRLSAHLFVHRLTEPTHVFRRASRAR
jgi:hypothetical protein